MNEGKANSNILAVNAGIDIENKIESDPQNSINGITDIDQYNDQCIKSVQEYFNKYMNSLDQAYFFYKESLHEERLYEQINNEKLHSFLKNTTILILTATKIETGILHNRIFNSTNKKITQIRQDNITCYFADWGRQKIVNVWQDSTGSETSGGSADTLRDVFDRFTPKVIISLGICFGIDFNNQRLSDVLIADKIFPYDVGFKVDAGIIKIKEDNSYKTVQGIIHGLRQKRSLTDIEHSTPLGSYRVHIGHFLTGEAVVSDEKYKRMILDAFKGVHFLGGEMEGYGVYKEADRKQIPCVIIKAICDWGTVKNGLAKSKEDDERIKDSLQTYAMYNACDVCETILKDKQVFSVDRRDAGNPDSGRRRKMALGVCIILLAAAVLLGLLYKDVLNPTKPANIGQTVVLDTETPNPSAASASSVFPVMIGGVEYSSDLKVLNLSRSDDSYGSSGLENSDIIGLKYMTNLEELDLSNNDISDITPLQNLYSLKKLSVSNNTFFSSNGEILNLMPLMNLTKLEELDISKNGITSVDVLKYLPNLRTLDASYNEITNFKPLGGKKNLEKLNVSGNSAEELMLGSMESLRFLNASNCSLKSVNFNTDNVLPNLQLLNLSFNEFDPESYDMKYDFKYIQTLSNLEILDLSSCNLKEITNLGKLINLKKLSLYGNDITNIDALPKLRSLEYLHLGGNLVQDVAPLSNMKKLNYLDLSDLYFSSTLWEGDIISLKSGKSFSDLSSLVNLGSVTTLALCGNHLADISVLSSMKQLKVLDLRYNSIEDIHALFSLENLQRLLLSWNKVKDLIPVSKLPLTRLDIDGNEIEDISAIQGNNELIDLNCGSSYDFFQYTSDPESEYYRDFSTTAQGNSTNDNEADGSVIPDRDRYNFISDISALAFLKELNNLDLDGNPIKDLSPLSGLSKLHTLSVVSESAAVDDWSPVANVPNVKR